MIFDAALSRGLTAAAQRDVASHGSSTATRVLALEIRHLSVLLKLLTGRLCARLLSWLFLSQVKSPPYARHFSPNSPRPQL